MYNPFVRLSIDRTAQTSFWQKLKDIRDMLAGTDEHVGLLDYVEYWIPVYLRWLEESSDEHERFRSVTVIRYINRFIAWILILPLTPIVGVVHLFTQPVIPGHTRLWCSFLMHPGTWFTLAGLTLGIGFLIEGIPNPLIFGQAATPLAILVPTFLAIGTLATFGVLLYLGYRAFRHVFRKSAAKITDLQKEDEIEMQDLDSSEEPYIEAVETLEDDKLFKNSEVTPNYVFKYFNEGFAWISKYKIVGGLIWGIGFSVLLTAIVFTALHFAGGILPDSVELILKQVFDFISQGFLAGFQGLAKLPGLEFIASISPETMALSCQILSIISVVAGILTTISTISRIAETVVRIPQEQIEYCPRAKYDGDRSIKINGFSCTAKTTPDEYCALFRVEVDYRSEWKVLGVLPDKATAENFKTPTVHY